MTTRRGFMGGIFAGLAALVMPKVAEAEVASAPAIIRGHGVTVEIDGQSIAGTVESFDTQRLTSVGVAVSQELLDDSAYTLNDIMGFIERDRQRQTGFYCGTGSGIIVGCVDWEPGSCADCNLVGLCGHGDEGPE